MKRIAALAFLCAPALVWADTIHLQSGGTLEGVILKKDQDGVVVRLKYATVTVGSFDIASVESSAAAPVAGARLAGWERCFQAMAARPWGADLSRSGSVAASSAIVSIASTKASSVSFASVSVGSIISASGTTSGK